uniref:Uncharacterized protein n=1 Tax=Anguilla anguilla TaxID=7936 RepID=A0A0E9RUU1_ANGAN
MARFIYGLKNHE